MRYGVYQKWVVLMPTALDRVQVLLQPEEYAELSMLAKGERRSLASMAAVLINDAIKQRVREGTFTPSPDDPAYANALNRQQAKIMGKDAAEEAKDELSKVMENMGGKLVSRRVKKEDQVKIEDVLTLKEVKS